MWRIGRVGLRDPGENTRVHRAVADALAAGDPAAADAAMHAHMDLADREFRHLQESLSSGREARPDV
jgi:DNA-binding FadR family transcriptional regulator